jgi:uncharacterized membrane protein
MAIRAVMIAGVAACAVHFAHAQSLRAVVPLPGDTLTLSPVPSTLSADGSVWVGISARTPSFGDAGRSRGVRVVGASVTDLGVLAGSQDTLVTGIDATGTVAVGRCIGGVPNRAFRYNALTSTLSLIAPPAGSTSNSALGISADAQHIFGVAGGGQTRWWSLTSGVYTFATLPVNVTSLAPSASTAAGGSIVGSATVSTSQRPFRWDVPGQVTLLTLPNGYVAGAAAGISSDGSVIVGRASVGTTEVAVVWEGGVPRVLAALRPQDVTSRAVAISADGAVIIGESADVADDRYVWVYTLATGIRRLDEVLYQQGLDTSAWALRNAGSVNADGLTISGTGVLRNAQGTPATRAFIAQLTTLCPTDWNGDGGIDGSDVDAFFVDWSAGFGDINVDGAVDGSDVQNFFDRWSLGIC